MYHQVHKEDWGCGDIFIIYIYIYICNNNPVMILDFVFDLD